MSSLIINANALFIPLANKSVHTIVTSPPYYGLRDYGTATWQGGDSECKHYVSGDGLPGETNAGEKQQSNHGSMRVAKDVCPHCGAVRIDEQIGLEVTPDAYIANLVEVFRECKRILRDDGTLWVNIGDSYVSNTGDRNKVGGFQSNPSDSRLQAESAMSFNKKSGDLKSKDLIGIPWMLAFALRADGWYLRQDIIWAKPNPMPESVKDRCTKSHEYIFLLSKSARYYYDSEAIKEPYTSDAEPPRDRSSEGYNNSFTGGRWSAGARDYYANGGRNKRDVWTVTTKPYKGAHYATFNPELIKPCILAGAPETCCAKCGAPYVRVVERKKGAQESTARPKGQGQGGYGVKGSTLGIGGGGHGNAWKEKGTKVITTGYQPACNCNAGTSSGIVFDPFVGSGTTVATAIQLGRKGIGLDLSLKYLRENARERIYEQEMQPTISF